MLESENTPQTSDEPQGKALSYGPELRLGLATMLTAFLASLAFGRFGILGALATGLIGAAALCWAARRRRQGECDALDAVLDSLAKLEPQIIDWSAAGSASEFVRAWNRVWPDRCASIRRLSDVANGIQQC